MYPTLNNPIGEAFFQNLLGNVTFNNPTTGRAFFVAKSGITNEAEIKATYASVYYPDGTPILYTTLKAALASCVASRGDTIVIAPGHTETITAAAGSGVTVAGVTVVGLGLGTLVPTFTFTTSTAASFDITASNVRLQNIIFTCGIDAQTAMVNVTGTDVTFQGCLFNTNSGTVGAILGILTGATSDRLNVTMCRFLGPAVNTGTTTTAQIQYESAVDIQIQNSYFAGKMTQAILNVTGTVLRGLIYNNNFVIATGTKAISVAAASTPFISTNNINVPSGTAPVIAAAGFVVNNRYSAAAGVTAGPAITF
jgi:hypothetical protein